MLELEHGKPLIFGKNRDKGIRLNGMDPEVVELGKGISEDDLLFHDEKAPRTDLAYLLSRMRHPDFPEPIGVFRDVDRPTYDELMTARSRRPSPSAARATWRSSSTAAKPGPSAESTRSDLVICPVCHFDNIAGSDDCENCGADLRYDGPAGRRRRGRRGGPADRALGRAQPAPAGRGQARRRRRGGRAPDAGASHRLRGRRLGPAWSAS